MAARANSNPEYLAEAIASGDVVALSRGITLVESRSIADREAGRTLIDLLLPKTGKSFRLGITGAPGAGKSTFIERFGQLLVEEGHRLAVLAIDPTSSRTKGSILGDKTRMTQLSVNKNVYIRPSPSGGMLGGTAEATFAAILLCEAAGFDFIIVETVGVGQSETAVSGVTDFFLLLMLAGAGDELQGIKRGIMELADAVVITKADGENADKARRARAEFSRAMHLLQVPESGWTPKVLTCSAVEGTGMKEIYQLLKDFRQHTQSSGYLLKNRERQFDTVLKSVLNAEILSAAYREYDLENRLENLVKKPQGPLFRELNEVLKHIGFKKTC